jgi:hypothetical protein
VLEVTASLVQSGHSQLNNSVPLRVWILGCSALRCGIGLRRAGQKRNTHTRQQVEGGEGGRVEDTEGAGETPAVPAHLTSTSTSIFVCMCTSRLQHSITTYSVPSTMENCRCPTLWRGRATVAPRCSAATTKAARKNSTRRMTRPTTTRTWRTGGPAPARAEKLRADVESACSSSCSRCTARGRQGT